MPFLISYDIENNRLRTKIASRLIAAGCVRLQKSVFAGPVPDTVFKELSRWLKEVIKELIQSNATPELLQTELHKLLNDAPYISSIKAEYEKLFHLLDTGSASDNTARLMTEHLNNVV